MNSYVLDGDKGAYFSVDRRYRYTLWRRWGGMLISQPTVTFIGLNPSTADEMEDDPTIRRCVHFAKRWGFTGMIMLNIFGFRATDPKVMKKEADPIGPRNDHVIHRVCNDSPLIVACWGEHGSHRNRDMEVKLILRWMMGRVCCFGKTSSKQPLHPLYLRRERKLERLIGERSE